MTLTDLFNIVFLELVIIPVAWTQTELGVFETPISVLIMVVLYFLSQFIIIGGVLFGVASKAGEATGWFDIYNTYIEGTLTWLTFALVALAYYVTRETFVPDELSSSAFLELINYSY